jgi:hypothetical protein
LLPLVLGVLVSLAVGLLARSSAERGGFTSPAYKLFFSDTIHLKVWFAMAAVALACVQLFTAAWIFRKLYWPGPRGSTVHRWAGRAAFLCTLPVVYHCVFKLGFQKTDTRVARPPSMSWAARIILAPSPPRLTIVRLHRVSRLGAPARRGELLSRAPRRRLVHRARSTSTSAPRQPTVVGRERSRPVGLPPELTDVWGGIIARKQAPLRSG